MSEQQYGHYTHTRIDSGGGLDPRSRRGDPGVAAGVRGGQCEPVPLTTSGTLLDRRLADGRYRIASG